MLFLVEEQFFYYGWSIRRWRSCGSSFHIDLLAFDVIVFILGWYFFRTYSVGEWKYSLGLFQVIFLILIAFASCSCSVTTVFSVVITPRLILVSRSAEQVPSQCLWERLFRASVLLKPLTAPSFSVLIRFFSLKCPRDDSLQEVYKATNPFFVLKLLWVRFSGNCYKSPH